MIKPDLSGKDPRAVCSVSLPVVLTNPDHTLGQYRVRMRDIAADYNTSYMFFYTARQGAALYRNEWSRALQEKSDSGLHGNRLGSIHFYTAHGTLPRLYRRNYRADFDITYQAQYVITSSLIRGGYQGGSFQAHRYPLSSMHEQYALSFP